MQSLFVIDGNFFAGMNVSQSKEQYVPVQILHEGVRLARVIDVMRAVTAAAAIQAQTAVDVADAQDSAVAAAPGGFEIRDTLARVLGDLFAARKQHRSKAASAVDAGLFDSETGCELKLHQ